MRNPRSESSFATPVGRSGEAAGAHPALGLNAILLGWAMRVVLG